MKKKLREAIENIDMVNNIDGQDFDKEFVGTAPVSYADAVLRARKHREDAKKSCEEQTKLAEEVLKKEISNAEHPEPLDKIKVNGEGKMTLDEGLFESLTEERSDVSLAKEALNEIIERIHLGMSGLEELLDLDISDDARSRIDDAASDIAQVLDRLSLVARRYLKESFDDEHTGKVELREWAPSHAVWVKREGKWIPYSALDFDTLSDEEVAEFKGLGYDDVKLLPNDGSEPDEVVESVVCPKCGKEPCECELEESLYPEYVSYQGKKMRVQGIRPDGKYALSEPKYSGLDITNHPEYLIDVSKEEVKSLEESTEGVKVFRVTYKHSPEVFSSVMVRATSEDEAKKKLSTKKPGKDIVGVSVMTDDEVEGMKKRGMSLMEAKVVDDFVNYEPWGEAVRTFDTIQDAGKMDALEQLIDDMYPDGINRTDLNDLLAFEADWVYSMLDMPHELDYDEPAVDFDEEEVVDEA